MFGGPRLYRFYNYEQPLYLPAPTGGWNPDANPWELPVSEAVQLDNFLIRPGKIVMRGPLVIASDMSSSFPVYPCGAVVRGDGHLIIGRKNSSTIVDPWNVPLYKPTASGNLAAGLTAGLQTNLNTSSISAFTFANADSIPGPRSINFDGLIYGISYDSAGAAVNDANSTYVMKPLSLYTMTNTSTVTITPLTNAPHGAFDLIGYQSRIWLLGGIDTPGAGATHDPLALFFTIPIASGGGSASSDWKDPVSNLTNKIVMDGDADDYGVGLAVVRNGMLIFRRSSVWLLKGTTTANYALVPLSRDVGCVDARSIVETDHGVYFMSLQGLMLTNGSTVVNASGNLTYLLRQAVQFEQTNSQNGGWISCVTTAQGQIIVSIGTNGSVNTQARLTAMYDPNAIKGGAWVRITSPLWVSDCQQVGAVGNNYAGQLFQHQSPRFTIGIGDRYVTVFECLAGGGQQSSFLDPTSGLYDQQTSSVFLAIPAIWKTAVPAITISTKRVIAQGKRYYIDYSFAATGLVPTTGWSLAPFDSAGNSMDPAAPVGVPVGTTPTTNGFVSGVTPVSGSFIQRLNQDFYSEITKDVIWTVQWTDSTRAAQVGSTIAEIYGMGIELQKSREARTSGQS